MHLRMPNYCRSLTRPTSQTSYPLCALLWVEVGARCYLYHTFFLFLWARESIVASVNLVPIIIGFSVHVISCPRLVYKFLLLLLSLFVIPSHVIVLGSNSAMTSLTFSLSDILPSFFLIFPRAMILDGYVFVDGIFSTHHSRRRFLSVPFSPHSYCYL